MIGFKVGDRVRCISGYEGNDNTPHTGWTGTVYHIDEDGVSAEWDELGRRTSKWEDYAYSEDLEIAKEGTGMLSLDEHLAAFARHADGKDTLSVSEHLAAIEQHIASIRKALGQ